MSKEVVLTAEGKEKLEAELFELETVKRVEIGERIRIAREFGDISENSEYDDAKNEQAWMESRIAEITGILATASIAEPPKRPSKVAVGSVVIVEMKDAAERKFTIVGAAEADSAEGRISNESPVGAALIGKKKGQSISVSTPNGSTIEMKIIKIS
ncbi:MAG: transcription elongation factor GreA [Coriobacteriia bacterium]|nr:transcription elongation factor GreA [Coriobacteriia bacterium]